MLGLVVDLAWPGHWDTPVLSLHSGHTQGLHEELTPTLNNTIQQILPLNENFHNSIVSL